MYKAYCDEIKAVFLCLMQKKKSQSRLNLRLLAEMVDILPRAKQQQRVALADFSAAPWPGFEKSERGPNNSSLFQPLAAVVGVAVRILPAHRKSQPVVRHSYTLGTAH